MVTTKLLACFTALYVLLGTIPVSMARIVWDGSREVFWKWFPLSQTIGLAQYIHIKQFEEEDRNCEVPICQESAKSDKES